jgi:hypothetical protein
MPRKNTARSATRSNVSTRKKAVASRRSAELVEAAPSSVLPPAARLRDEPPTPTTMAMGDPQVQPNDGLPLAPAQPGGIAPVAPPSAESLVPDFEPSSVPAPPAARAPYTMTRAEFEATVRREAWLLAEARSFRNGSPLEDWLRAETAVRARLQAEGVSIV